MKAAGLKDIDTVLETTAVLIRSNKVSDEDLVQRITKRIKGVISMLIQTSLFTPADRHADAQSYVLCLYNIHRSSLERACKITPGKRAPTITALEAEDWVAVNSMVHKRDIANVMDELSEVGAQDILVLNLVNSRTE